MNISTFKMHYLIHNIQKSLQFFTLLILFSTIFILNGCAQSSSSTNSSSSDAMLSYAISNYQGFIEGNNISVEVPYNMDVTNLTATFKINGVVADVNNVPQVSGLTINNFSAPVIYEVIAADGSKSDYTVKVTKASQSSKAITKYSINGINGVISGFDISVILPYNTDITNLIATFTTTGASARVNNIVQVSGQTSNNFTAPVKYTITAFNETTAVYTIRVFVASNSSKAITEYSLNGKKGVISGFNISVVMPYNTNITNLIATFTITGVSASINNVVQVSGQTENNFTNPVVYTITAADGSTANYTVTVKLAPNKSNAIIQYSLNGTRGVISGFNISVLMPSGTDVTSLIATFTITGVSASINNVVQVSGQTENNFTNPVVYTVTAANGATANYTVTVTVAPSPSNAITQYSLNGTSGVISGSNISVLMPSGTNVTSLIATFTITGVSASINNVVQVSGQTENNFTNPVVYTVTAANGATANYTVTVTVAPNPSNAITQYSLNGTSGVISGSNIAVLMPSGTDVTSLIATFTITGVSASINNVVQVSGQTENNFTNPVVYTVTAANGATANYTVTVTVAPSPSNAITQYSLNGTSGVISGSNISVLMPSGTNVTSLIATFTITGVSASINNVVQVSGQTANNFTNPVVYTVTAANGATANYTVTVTVAPNPSKAITAFSLNGISSVISGLNIYVNMPFNVNFNVTNLIATFTTTGQNVKINTTTQVSGQTSNNFTNPLVYTVTAADGSTANYTVTVTAGSNQISFGDTPNGIATTPNGAFLFTATSGQYINWLTVNTTTGILTYQGHLQLGDVPNSVAASNSYVFAGTDGQYIDSFSINQSTGAVTFLSNLQLQDVPNAVAVSPNGKFLYSSTNGGYIDWFNINQSTGAVTFAGNLQLQDTPTGVVVSPDGNYLYAVTNGGIQSYGYIDWFSINQSTGAVTFLGNLQLQDVPLNITISPNGNILYVTTNGGYVDGFNITQSTGSIIFAGNYFFAGGEVFNGIANSLNNSYLYLIGQTSGSTSVGWVNVPLF